MKAVADADGPVTVVAHSWGAHVTLRAAAGWGAIGRIVAYEPPHPYRPERRASLTEAIEEADWEAFLQVFLRLEPERVRVLRGTARWLELLELAPSTAHEAAVFMGLDLSRESFAGVEAPTLVLVGDRSEPDRHRFLRDLAGWLPSGSLDVIPGHGHFAMRDDPDGFACRVRRFLAPNSCSEQS